VERKIGKQNNLKVLWDNTSINRMDKIGSGHLCMRKENLGFENNYII
jgi:hypothetical protein